MPSTAIRLLDVRLCITASVVLSSRGGWNHDLIEARKPATRVGFVDLAKRAITAYLESGGDKMHLSNVPFSLQAVRGGLWFLEQPRAAMLVGACAD